MLYSLPEFLLDIKQALCAQGCRVRDVRLHGSAASAVLGAQDEAFNDVDIVFNMDFSYEESQVTYDFVIVSIISRVARPRSAVSFSCCLRALL